MPFAIVDFRRFDAFKYVFIFCIWYKDSLTNKVKFMALDLLQSLVSARGPCGQEDEVRAVCLKHLTTADAVWTDPAGNLIGKVEGKDRSQAIRIFVHMDELSLIV